MIGKFLNRKSAGRQPPQGLARDLLRLQMAGPPGAGDLALGTLLLRDPPHGSGPPPSGRGKT
jgi:hypothetical protein